MEDVGLGSGSVSTLIGVRTSLLPVYITTLGIISHHTIARSKGNKGDHTARHLLEIVHPPPLGTHVQRYDDNPTVLGLIDSASPTIRLTRGQYRSHLHPARTR